MVKLCEVNEIAYMAALMSIDFECFDLFSFVVVVCVRWVRACDEY